MWSGTAAAAIPLHAIGRGWEQLLARARLGPGVRGALAAALTAVLNVMRVDEPHVRACTASPATCAGAGSRA